MDLDPFSDRLKERHREATSEVLPESLGLSESEADHDARPEELRTSVLEMKEREKIA